MIQVTDEMIADAMQAHNATGSYASAVEAVLAIVERDYRVTRRCQMGDPWCEAGISTCSRCVLDRLHAKLNTSPKTPGGDRDA